MVGSCDHIIDDLARGGTSHSLTREQTAELAEALIAEAGDLVVEG